MTNPHTYAHIFSSLPDILCYCYPVNGLRQIEVKDIDVDPINQEIHTHRETLEGEGS